MTNHHDDSTEETPLKKRRISSIRKKPKASYLKWLILSLCCLVMGAMYYILAMPAALHRQLYAVMPNNNFEMNFNLLFTVSYFPNMILPIFGGTIVDKYGQSKCLLFFCIVVLCGQILTSLGVSYVSWKCMWAGRFIFGCGAQNLIVANASLISKWFAGSEGVALGLSNVCSYAGVILTNMLSPKLANVFRPSFSFWLGVVIEAVAIVLAIFIVVLDKSKKAPSMDAAASLVCSPMFSPVAFRHMSTTPNTTTASTSYVPSPGVTFATAKRTTNQVVLGSKRQKFKPTFWLLCASFLLIYGVVWSFTNVSSAILLERNFFLKTPKDCVPLHPNECTSGTLVLSDDGNPSYNSDGKQCPIQDNAAPATPQSLNVTFNDKLSFDHHKYTFDTLKKSDIQCHDDFWSTGCTMNYCLDQNAATEMAGFFMSIPYFFTVALTFHLGLLVDKTGWRTEMICLGSVLLVIAHVLLAFPASSPPVVPLVGQGLGYTICVASLWPSVPFTVSEDSVGTAFGIMMGVQNIGLALIPLVVAGLFERSNHRYLPLVELFFAAISFLAVLVGIALMICDKKTNHILATPKIDIRFDERNEPVIVKHARPRALSDANVYP